MLDRSSTKLQLQLERGPGNVKKSNEHADMTWLKMQMDMHDTQ